MSRRRRLAPVAALAAAALALPAGASAAGNPYTAVQICGPTYALAQSNPLYSNNGKALMGYVQLAYSLTTGKSCGVTLKVRQVGKPTFTSVSIAKYKRDMRKVTWKDDSGYFSYYAGPKYVDGVPACARVGGYMNVVNGHEGFWVEPGFEHCAP